MPDKFATDDFTRCLNCNGSGVVFDGDGEEDNCAAGCQAVNVVPADHTEEIRKAKEEAWDEGHMHGFADKAYYWLLRRSTPNPNQRHASSPIPARSDRENEAS